VQRLHGLARRGQRRGPGELCEQLPAEQPVVAQVQVIALENQRGGLAGGRVSDIAQLEAGEKIVPEVSHLPSVTDAL
jgi:hypothetical protein